MLYVATFGSQAGLLSWDRGRLARREREAREASRCRPARTDQVVLIVEKLVLGKLV